MEKKENWQQLLKEYWNIIIGNKDGLQSPSLKKADGSYTQTPKDTMECATAYFENLFKQKSNLKPSKKEKLRTVGKALHKKIQAIEILSAITRLKLSKSAGPDCIPNKFFKWAGPSIRPMLLDLFNTIHKDEKVPEAWKSLYLICLFKGKGDPGDLHNYRGIALNNTIS